MDCMLQDATGATGLSYFQCLGANMMTLEDENEHDEDDEDEIFEEDTSWDRNHAEVKYKMNALGLSVHGSPGRVNTLMRDALNELAGRKVDNKYIPDMLDFESLFTEEGNYTELFVINVFYLVLI